MFAGGMREGLSHICISTIVNDSFAVNIFERKMIMKKIVIGILCLGAVAAGIYGMTPKGKEQCRKAFRVLKKEKKNPETEEQEVSETDFGTDDAAEFETAEDYIYDFSKVMSENPESNLLFGKINGKEVGIAFDSEINQQRNTNTLIVGMTGTGKTFNYCTSNILNGNASIVLFKFNYGIYPYLFSESFLNSAGYETKTVSEETMNPEKLAEKLREKKTAVIMNLNTEFCSKAVHALFQELKKQPEGNHVLFWLDEYPNWKQPVYGLNHLLAEARTANTGFQIISQTLNAFSKKVHETESNLSEVFSNFDSIVLLRDDFDMNLSSAMELFGESVETEKAISRVSKGKEVIFFTGGVYPVVCEKLNPDDYHFAEIMTDLC